MSRFFPALDPLAGDHVVIAKAWPDHRVDTGVAINNEVPTEIAEPMDALAAKAEAIKHGD